MSSSRRHSLKRTATSPDSEASPSRIIGTGEMADLIRAFEWEGTPFGPVETWSDTLVTAVNLLLASRHPMFLWWGSELIQFYNDGYRPSIRADKHPSAIGQRGIECWPEIWPIIGPQIGAVMNQGTSTWNLNQLVPINRNGKLEEVYWTYSYSPVREIVILLGDVSLLRNLHNVEAELGLKVSSRIFFVGHDAAIAGAQLGILDADSLIHRGMSPAIGGVVAEGSESEGTFIHVAGVPNHVGDEIAAPHVMQVVSKFVAAKRIVSEILDHRAAIRISVRLGNFFSRGLRESLQQCWTNVGRPCHVN